MLKKNLLDFLSKEGESSFEPTLDVITLQARGSTLVVKFPHHFYGSWFMTNKRVFFEQAIQTCFPHSFSKITYEDLGETSLEKQNSKVSAQTTTPSKSKAEQVKNQKNQPLASFLHNEGNALPVAILNKIAIQPPGTAFNSVLLCGPIGSGKTHLLEGVAQAFEQKKYKIFLCQHPHLLAENSLLAQADFFWQEYSALFIDDIQELTIYPELQSLLVHFIDVCPKNRQILFTLTGNLSDNENLDLRLRNRLGSGLVIELLLPDLSLKVKYVEKICQQEKLNLAKKYMLYLAQHAANYRQLKGLVTKIIAVTSIQKKTITQEELEQIVKVSKTQDVLSYHTIMSEVAQKMQVSVVEILSSQRHNNLVRARQVAMYLCRQRLGLSYPELGRIFGGKDHSTVIHSIRKIESLILTDQSLSKLIEQMSKEQ